MEVDDLTKVLSCKVPDDIYHIVDKMKKSHSEILREAIYLYLEKKERKKQKRLHQYTS
jgi:metal-responsive CopG/Arc/MetJ family transcriptional regulator